jgi:hypothetical protein
MGTDSATDPGSNSRYKRPEQWHFSTIVDRSENKEGKKTLSNLLDFCSVDLLGVVVGPLFACIRRRGSTR